MDKRALITGASSGIGLEIARKLASKGYDLLLIARSKDKLAELKSELESGYGIKADILIKDLAKDNAAEDIYKYTKSKDMHIDMLVNNAGFGDYGIFYQRDIKLQNKMVRVNIIALMELTYYYLPDMIAVNKGRILNVASVAAFAPGPMMSTYYASKGFVLQFTEAMQAELNGTNVKISALCPGPIDTNFSKVAGLKACKGFRGFRTTDIHFAVDYAIKKWFKNKAVIIPGFFNKVYVNAVRFLPRRVVKMIIYYLQKN